MRRKRRRREKSVHQLRKKTIKITSGIDQGKEIYSFAFLNFLSLFNNDFVYYLLRLYHVFDEKYSKL